MAPEQDRYWLVARDKPALLSRMMRLLAGDAQISFEGDLARCVFPETVPRIPEGASPLRRQTAYPALDFIVLELSQETIRPILDAVLPENRYKDDIIHIQIAQHRKLQFGSYDQFHEQCIVCFRSVPTKVLDELKERHIILSWTAPYEGAKRWHG